MKISDLQIWESFYWVAKEASFSKAAEKMRIGAPLMTRRITQLEDSLKARLFHRTTRKVGLTAEGAAILPVIETLLADFRNVENKFDQKQTVAGTIRLTASSNFANQILCPILTDFCTMYPDIKLELELTDHFLDLIEARIDVAIRIQSPKDSSFIAKKLGTNELIFCASPQYLKQTKKKLKSPEDLAEHPLLFLPIHSDVAFIGRKEKVGDLANIIPVHCNQAALLTNLTTLGLGIGLRSKWDVVDKIRSGELVQVLEKHPLASFGEILALMPTNRLLAHRVRVFFDYLVAATQKQLSH